MLKRMAKHLALIMALLMVGTLTAWASVPDTTFENVYTGNGSTTAYTFTWRLIDPTQLFVQLNGTTQPTSNYTVFQNTSGVGGTITFNSAPSNGAAILIERQSDFLQAYALQNNGALPPQTIEAIADKLTILCQQLETQITNSGTLPLNPAKGTLLVGTGSGWSSLSVSPVDGQALCARSTAGLGLDYETISGGGGGGGSGTVGNGGANQVGYYPGAGTTIGGENSLTAGQMMPLTTGQMYVGNVSNLPAAITPSGDIALSSLGQFTLPNIATPGTYSSVTVNAKGQVTSGSASSSFISTAQTPSLSTLITVPQSLGLTPSQVWTVWQCTTANDGYASGDQVILYPSSAATGSSTGEAPFTVRADASNVYVAFNGASSQPYFVAKTGSSGNQIVYADWEFFVHAAP